MTKDEKFLTDMLDRGATVIDSTGVHTGATGFFKTLDAEDEKDYRQWARDNYKVGDPVAVCWHPAVRDECAKMNAAAKENEND